MCTVTWLREAGGYQLFFNRDERRTRKRAVPPTVHLNDGVQKIYPVDADAGGSWLGVNQQGVTLGMLNYYQAQAAMPAPGKVSRGVLLVSLLAAASVTEAMGRAEQDKLTDYAPFMLVGLEPGRALERLTWDGQQPVRDTVETPAMITTSAFEGGVVIEARQEYFREVEKEHGPLSVADLVAFHASEHPEAGPYAVCMSRPDACTVSFSHISVTPERIAFAYADGPPCEVGLGAPVEMPRLTE